MERWERQPRALTFFFKMTPSKNRKVKRIVWDLFKESSGPFLSKKDILFKTWWFKVNMKDIELIFKELLEEEKIRPFVKDGTKYFTINYAEVRA